MSLSVSPFVDVAYTSYPRDTKSYIRWLNNVLYERTIPTMSQFEREHPSRTNTRGDLYIRDDKTLYFTYHVDAAPPSRGLRRRGPQINTFKDALVMALYHYRGVRLTCTRAYHSDVDVPTGPVPEDVWIEALKLLGKLKFPLLYEITPRKTVRFLNVRLLTRDYVSRNEHKSYLEVTVMPSQNADIVITESQLEISKPDFVTKFKTMSGNFIRRHSRALFTQPGVAELPPEIHEKIMSDVRVF